MHAMGEISETAFKPLRFGVWNIKHNAPCKSIACLEWRIWERARERKARESENKSGREGVSEWVTCIWVFPTAAVCVFVCAWAGFLAVVPFCLGVQESSFNPLLSQSPPPHPITPDSLWQKALMAQYFTVAFESRLRERETLGAHLSHLLPLLHMWHSLRSLLIHERNLERALGACDKLLWSATIGSDSFARALALSARIWANTHLVGKVAIDEAGRRSLIEAS